jgi:hypothetical protein
VQATLNRAWFKRVAGFAGAMLGLAAIVLLVRRGIALGGSLGEQLTRIPLPTLMAALALYVLGALLLSASWVLLVRLASGESVRAMPLAAAHLKSQLAKYLPGNVFHFAYRHVAARREGVGHCALGFALALESLLLIVAAALYSFGVVVDPRVSTLAPWARSLILGMPFLMVMAWACMGLIGRRAGLEQLAPRRTAFPFLAALVIDLAFFLFAAMALRLLCDTANALPFAAWCGWLSLAWALGYVTPGAPAGLGLREAVLALGLAPAVGEANALALALAYRCVTLVADGILAFLGFATARWTT